MILKLSCTADICSRSDIQIRDLKGRELERSDD
jgi:hypothetical protein